MLPGVNGLRSGEDKVCMKINYAQLFLKSSENSYLWPLVELGLKLIKSHQKTNMKTPFIYIIKWTYEFPADIISFISQSQGLTRQYLMKFT